LAALGNVTEALMRSKLIGLLLGCGLIAATAASAFACEYGRVTASSEPPPQQQAQTDTSSRSQ
jgi:hypothetical protein